MALVQWCPQLLICWIVSFLELKTLSLFLWEFSIDIIYKKDGVLNPAQIYGEALTVGLTLDDIKKWQEKVNNISLNDVKKALEKLYENKNYVLGELLNWDLFFFFF